MTSPSIGDGILVSGNGEAVRLRAAYCCSRCGDLGGDTAASNCLFCGKNADDPEAVENSPKANCRSLGSVASTDIAESAATDIVSWLNAVWNALLVLGLCCDV